MSKAMLKESTKSNVIIVNGPINEDRQRETLPAQELRSPASFDGDSEGAIKFYASEIKLLTTGNAHLSTQLRQALEEKKELADLIASFEELSKDDTDDKKKRVRRCANQIERKYICQVEGCRKSYGTEGSMAQHMKLKHPEIDYILPSSLQDPKNKKDVRKEEEYEDSYSSKQ